MERKQDHSYRIQLPQGQMKPTDAALWQNWHSFSLNSACSSDSYYSTVLKAWHLHDGQHEIQVSAEGSTSPPILRLLGKKQPYRLL